MSLKDEHFVVTGTEKRGERFIKVGMFYCLLNNKTYDTMYGLRNAIRVYGYTSKQYYDEFYKSETEGYCIVCGNQCSFDNVFTGYKRCCSTTCFNRTPEKRLIVSTRFENQETYSLYKERINFTIANRTEEQRSKISLNCRNGHLKLDPIEVRERLMLANKILQEKRSTDPVFRQAMIDKTLATKAAKGSFANGLSGKIKFCEYKGYNFSCQGYEDILIKFLIDEEINFINGKEIPVVKVDFNASKKYVSDIFLPEYNLLIDVKSEYTMPIKPETVSNMIKRQNATYEQGMNFVIFAIHSKTIKLKDRILCEDDQQIFRQHLTMLISSQALIEGRFNDYPVIRSTLQAIGSGSAGNPKYGL